MAKDIPEYRKYVCYSCGRDILHKMGTANTGHGSNFVFKNRTTNRLICVKCQERPDNIGHSNYLNGYKPPEPEPVPDPAEGINVTLEDYEILKFARSNSLVRFLYRFRGK